MVPSAAAVAVASHFGGGDSPPLPEEVDAKSSGEGLDGPRAEVEGEAAPTDGSSSPLAGGSAAAAVTPPSVRPPSDPAPSQASDLLARPDRRRRVRSRLEAGGGQQAHQPPPPPARQQAAAGCRLEWPGGVDRTLRTRGPPRPAVAVGVQGGWAVTGARLGVGDPLEAEE